MLPHFDFASFLKGAPDSFKKPVVMHNFQFSVRAVDGSKWIMRAKDDEIQIPSVLEGSDYSFDPLQYNIYYAGWRNLTILLRAKDNELGNLQFCWLYENVRNASRILKLPYDKIEENIGEILGFIGEPARWRLSADPMERLTNRRLSMIQKVLILRAYLIYKMCTKEEYFQGITGLDYRKFIKTKWSELKKKIKEVFKGLKSEKTFVWKTDNPGTQLVGSFNPIFAEPRDWYGNWYIECQENITFKEEIIIESEEEIVSESEEEVVKSEKRKSEDEYIEKKKKSKKDDDEEEEKDEDLEEDE